MAGVKALQTNLAASLDAIGYKKRVATLPASLEQSRKLSQFVELTIDHIKPDNYLSTEQSKRWVCCMVLISWELEERFMWG